MPAVGKNMQKNNISVVAARGLQQNEDKQNDILRETSRRPDSVHPNQFSRHLWSAMCQKLC